MTATISPDQLMPATASRIAHGVGAVNAGSCDISAGCTGFVYALALATGMVSGGLHDHVLVVGAEVISRILDWEDRSTAILFGDGAGAAVISPAAGAGRILGFDLGNDGSGVDLLAIPAGGSRLPASHETVDQRQHYLRMNGREVFRFATRVIIDSAARVLEQCGRTIEEIDLFVPHQANLRIIDAAVHRMGDPTRSGMHQPRTLRQHLVRLDPVVSGRGREAARRLHEGDLVLLMGFGAGLTWGACLMEWGGT